MGKCFGYILRVYGGFFSHSLEYCPYKAFVAEKFEERDLFKAQGKSLLEN